MAGMVLIGAAAAFGVISILWVLLGWLLPSGKGALVVCWGEPDEGILARVKWLQSLGLLQGPLVAVMEAVPDNCIYNSMEYCSPGDLLSRLEQERIKSNGTGNGDPSGNHSGGGLPEL